jgi:type I site-specific restriction-modification system R (restriction) subunit
MVSRWPSLKRKARRVTARKGQPLKDIQSIRNQLNDEIPQLFAYSQILLSINGHDGRYGTCHTPMKFWAAWREDITDRRCMRCATMQVID